MLAQENFSETNNSVNNDGLQNGQPLIIPIIEETAQIGKQVITTGKIRIEKHVAEITEPATIDLLHDEYIIKRVSINEYVDEEAPQVRYEGTTMIIPVVKEVMVKRLLLVEEVHVVKEVKNTTEQIDIPLRSETVTVSRSTDNAKPSA